MADFEMCYTEDLIYESQYLFDLAFKKTPKLWDLTPLDEQNLSNLDFQILSKHQILLLYSLVHGRNVILLLKFM